MKKNKFILILVIVSLVFLITAWGCKKDTSLKYSTAETELKETQLQSLITHTTNELKNIEVSEEQINVEINTIRTNFNATNTKDVLVSVFSTKLEESQIESKVNTIYMMVVDDVKLKATSLLTKFYNLEDLKTHSKELVVKIVTETENNLATATEIEANIDSTKKIESSLRPISIKLNGSLDNARIIQIITMLFDCSVYLILVSVFSIHCLNKYNYYLFSDFELLLHLSKSFFHMVFRKLRWICYMQSVFVSHHGE